MYIHVCLRAYASPVLNIFNFNILKGQFYRVQVGVQSPEGITTTRGVLRRFNDFLKLFADVSPILFCLLASLLYGIQRHT